ncbi:uncharacterized protein LOC106158061 [Lingula anatina]|uniref:Uncharacterized protein LOC106158061 n=1 Tax=Lingula anatina TaxID=7574 RepID=A0A1S3HTI5_LINAN|nr:uncharacterized protein LOC106158061 [Lingula anatina]|eukprot:XP_013389355.1 uncharacterized protein LOC106158061 [Lingula anatina]
MAADVRQSGSQLNSRPFLKLPRLGQEKTMLPPSTPLTDHLESYYHNVAVIPEGKLVTLRKRAQKVIDTLLPRMRTNKFDIKFAKSVIYGGSVFDGTQVISAKEVDVFLPFDEGKCTTDLMEPGYMRVIIPRTPKNPPNAPDKYRYGRNEHDRKHLSPIRVDKSVYKVIEHALKYPIEIPNITLIPFEDEPQGKARVALMVKSTIKLNIIPTIVLKGNNANPPFDYLVTRTYWYDEYPGSELLWRYCHHEKEQRVMKTMELADRGTRIKAFKIIKAMFRREKTLHGLSSYHFKAVLFNSFDCDVDTSPRWQRDHLETCFLIMLTDLLQSISTRNLQDFFLEGFNLLANAPTREFTTLKNRLAMIVNNESELIRILRKI